MQNQKKSLGGRADSPRTPGKMKEHDLLREKVQQLWRQWKIMDREHATKKANVQKSSAILKKIETKNTQTSEILQNLQVQHNHLIEAAQSLVKKQAQINQKFHLIEEELSKYFAANSQVQDENYNHQLKDRIQQLEHQKIIEQQTVAKKSGEKCLAQLKIELTERRKLIESKQFELRRCDYHRNVANEAWRTKEAEMLENVELVKNDFEDKLSIMDGDVGVIQKFLDDGLLECRARIENAQDETAMLQDELENLQKQIEMEQQRRREHLTLSQTLQQRSQTSRSSKSPAISVKSPNNLEFRKPIGGDYYDREFERLKQMSSQRSKATNSQRSSTGREVTSRKRKNTLDCGVADSSGSSCSSVKQRGSFRFR